MKDKSDYARKGIKRGKSVVALDCADGMLFVAENPSTTLHKISEIYDRMAFAGVGKFNEFESLRMHGIRQADIRGYSYSREDVTARGLANSYSQILGQIFTEAMKPFEVEILVAAVGEDGKPNELYHILYDGSVADETDYVAMGGQSEELSAHLQANFKAGLPLAEAVKLGVESLRAVESRQLTAGNLEVAVLDRSLDRRKFRRITGGALAAMVGGDEGVPGGNS
jgi:proteasome alpha subunit